MQPNGLDETAFQLAEIPDSTNEFLSKASETSTLITHPQAIDSTERCKETLSEADQLFLDDTVYVSCPRDYRNQQNLPGEFKKRRIPLVLGIYLALIFGEAALGVPLLGAVLLMDILVGSYLIWSTVLIAALFTIFSFGWILLFTYFGLNLFNHKVNRYGDQETRKSAYWRISSIIAAGLTLICLAAVLVVFFL